MTGNTGLAAYQLDKITRITPTRYCYQARPVP